MFSLIHTNTQTYISIVKEEDAYFTISPPFIKKSSVKEETIRHGEFHLSESVSKFKTAEGLRQDLLSNFYFLVLSNFYSDLKKINEGSLDVISKDYLEEKVKNKLEAMNFIKQENPLVLRQIAYNYIAIYGVSEDFSDFLVEYFEDTSVSELIAGDIRLFSKWNVDKESMILSLKEKHLPRMKKKGMWESYRNAVFSLFTMARLLGSEEEESIKELYQEAGIEYEKNTGRDPNQSKFQRHTDRRSRNNYHQMHRQKFKGNDKKHKAE